MRQLGYIAAVMVAMALGCWSESLVTQAQRWSESAIEQIDEVSVPTAAGLLPDGQESWNMSPSRQTRTPSHSTRFLMTLAHTHTVRWAEFALSPPVPHRAVMRRAGSAYYVIALRHIIR